MSLKPDAEFLEIIARQSKQIEHLTRELALEKLVNFDQMFDIKPVAWRKKVGHQWHYLNENDPFPAQDWEPLYTRSIK